jgi:hypothetical protein
MTFVLATQATSTRVDDYIGEIDLRCYGYPRWFVKTHADGTRTWSMFDAKRN